MNREFRMSMAKIWNEDGCSRHTAECLAEHMLIVTPAKPCSECGCTPTTCDVVHCRSGKGCGCSVCGCMKINEKQKAMASAVCSVKCLEAHDEGLAYDPECPFCQLPCPKDCGGCSCHVSPPCSHCEGHR